MRDAYCSDIGGHMEGVINPDGALLSLGESVTTIDSWHMNGGTTYDAVYSNHPTDTAYRTDSSMTTNFANLHWSLYQHAKTLSYNQQFLGTQLSTVKTTSEDVQTKVTALETSVEQLQQAIASLGGVGGGGVTGTTYTWGVNQMEMTETIASFCGVGLLCWIFTYILNRIWLTVKRFVN